MNITQEERYTLNWHLGNSTKDKVISFIRSLLPGANQSSKGKVKLALIIGHNSKSGGAYAPYPINMNEFKFNSLVAKRQLERANEDDRVEIKIFYRKKTSATWREIDEVYDRVNAWAPDYAMEEHFNWLNQAGRVEMLHYPDSKESIQLAKYLLKGVGEVMDVPLGKRVLHARGKSDRGGRSLWACKCPIVMTEIFDCSNSQHLAKIDKLGPHGIADVLHDSFLNFLDKRSL